MTEDYPDRPRVWCGNCGEYIGFWVDDGDARKVAIGNPPVLIVDMAFGRCVTCGKPWRFVPTERQLKIAG